MELFGVNDNLDETLGKYLEPEDFYSPHLTKNELFKMNDTVAKQSLRNARSHSPKSFNTTSGGTSSKTLKPADRPEILSFSEKDVSRISPIYDEVFGTVDEFLLSRSRDLKSSRSKLKKLRIKKPKTNHISKSSIILGSFDDKSKKYEKIVQGMNAYAENEILIRKQNILGTDKKYKGLKIPKMGI